jgi:hypothetical protein
VSIDTAIVLIVVLAQIVMGVATYYLRNQPGQLDRIVQLENQVTEILKSIADISAK